MTTEASSEKKTPLRAGFNSVVPDPDKWLKFDHELRLSRLSHTQAATHKHPWRGHLLTQWSGMLIKLHLKTVAGK